jgi:hypothetical protein
MHAVVLRPFSGRDVILVEGFGAREALRRWPLYPPSKTTCDCSWAREEVGMAGYVPLAHRHGCSRCAGYWSLGSRVRSQRGSQLKRVAMTFFGRELPLSLPVPPDSAGQNSSP